MRKKRIISTLLILAILTQCLPLTAHAEEIDLSSEALMVSEEFVEKYPNGMIDIATQNTLVNEDAGEISIYVVRRGGTQGQVDVSLKAIEVTAKYGEDFVLLTDGLFGSQTVEKEVDSLTLLESSLADYGDDPVTVATPQPAEDTDTLPAEGETAAEDVVSEPGDGSAENDSTAAEDTSLEEDTAEETVVEETQAPETPQESETPETPQATETPQETEMPETPQATETPVMTEVSDDVEETPTYLSSLHEMRDSILGETTAAPFQSGTDAFQLFDVTDTEAVQRDEAINTVLPGATLSLHFDEGENYKIVRVKILDDDIIEDEETFMLGLFDVKGAVPGNNITSNICIQDNDVRVDETALTFETDNLAAYDQDSTVRLKLMRTNNINTYQVFQIRTLAGSAQADVNYNSLVTEAVLLAGQEYKYIDIPILRSGIEEPVDFQVIVTGDSCTSAAAQITIYPIAEASSLSASSTLASSTQPYITVTGGSFGSGSYADSGSVQKNYGGTTRGQVYLSSDQHRWGELQYAFDARGIERVVVRAQGYEATTKYPKRVTHTIWISGGNQTYTRNKNWGWEELTFSYNQFPHKKDSMVYVHADSTWWNDTKLEVDWIRFYKQQINITFEQPDTFKVPIYSGMDTIASYYMEDGKEKVVAPQANITAVNTNSSRPNQYYRDDTVNLTATLSSDGQAYGAYLKGYELYNPSSNTYTYFEGTKLTITPEIIGTYVYKGSEYRSQLRIRPVYDRVSVQPSITVGTYSQYRGTLSFGDEILRSGDVKQYQVLSGYTDAVMLEDYRYRDYYSWISVEDVAFWQDRGCALIEYAGKTYKNPNWKVGDYIAVTLDPAEGYAAAGVEDVNGNSISISNANTMLVQLKESGNTLVPVFNRTDCGVTIHFEGETDGLYVFHDQKQHADADFLSQLYAGTDGLSNWSGEEYTGALNQKILENYDVLRGADKLEGQTLSELAIGDVVTFYAQAPEGYIPYWYLEDGNGNLTSDNDKSYAKHYGNSFSFEMSSNDIQLTCGMVEKAAIDYVMTGKLVKPSQTLKGDGYAAVNPGIPASYIGVPNAALGVLTFDESQQSAQVDGVTYNSSVMTDSEGNFQMYVPNVSEREYFSVRYTNGSQISAKTLLAANGKTYYIVVPANDANYTVKSINCLTAYGTLAENNGEIRIPYESAQSNRTFAVTTIRSSENYVISKVLLNTYQKDGTLITSVPLIQNSALGLEQTWTATVNLSEILTDGGRITVEVFDQKGSGRGEVETGYTIIQEIEPADITVEGMPDHFSEMGLSTVPVLGKSIPTVPDAEFQNVEVGDSLEIAVGQGETLKKAIYDNLEHFNNEDMWSKLVYLSDYISDTYNVNVSNKKDEGEGPKDSAFKSKFPILFDFGMYLKFDKEENGDLTLDYVFVTVGLKAAYSKTFTWVVYGVPVYVTMAASGTARGLFGIVGGNDKLISENVKDQAFYALLGKYGQDAIPNKNYEARSTWEEEFFAALYNQANLTKSISQEEDALTKDFDDSKIDKTISALDTMLNRYDFYYDNEDLFAQRLDTFSYDLRARINTYKQLVTVISDFDPKPDATPLSDSGDENTRPPYQSSVIVEYDEDMITQAWVHQLNMLLLKESLPDYVGNNKPVYDLSAENIFGLGGGSTTGGDMLSTTGVISLKPTFSLGAGVGQRGAFSVGVSGHIDFVINWQPWSEARGTVAFYANLDIDLLIIPLSVKLASYTVEMFQTDGYRWNGFDDEEGAGGIIPSNLRFSQMDVFSSVNTAPDRPGGQNKLEAAPSLLSSYDDGLDYVEESLDYRTETTKHPQPQMYLLPNGNKLIVYLNDTLERGLYDRNSVYYALFDGNTWSASTELDPDGTLDGDVESLQLPDGRVALVWTNADKTFGDTLPELADLVTAQKISLCIFDANGVPGDIHTVAALDGYGFSEPALTYDSTDDLIRIAYKITDYHTQGVTFDYDDIEGTYQDFMTNSYETLAVSTFDLSTGTVVKEYGDQADLYAAYEANTGLDLNGLRFMDAGVDGLDNPKLYHIAMATFQDKTYLVYSMDLDLDVSTDSDRELFCIVEENGIYSKPIRLTDNTVCDQNPNVVVNDAMNAVYYGSGGNICYINLEDIAGDRLTDCGSYLLLNSAEEPTTSLLEYESEEAAESFRIFQGNNGILYLLWTQFQSSEDEEGQIHNSRALYMKTFDPRFEQRQYEDEELGTVTVDFGSWGLAGCILEEPDRYVNEPFLVVSADGAYSMAYRLFEMETVEEGGYTFQQEADTSTLCVSNFELVSSISAEKTSQYPLYPKQGDGVTVDFQCENYGILPSDLIQFNYFLVTDVAKEGYDPLNDCWWRPGDGILIDSDKYFASIKASTTIEGHMATGSSLGDSVSFVMPEFDQEVELCVLGWEDDLTYAFPSFIPVTVAPSLEASELSASISDDQETLSISGWVTNQGNQTAQDVVLTIYADGAYDPAGIMLDATNDGADLTGSGALGEDSEVKNQGIAAQFQIDSLAPGERYDLSCVFTGESETAAAPAATLVKKSKLPDTYFSSDGIAGFTLAAEYTTGQEEPLATLVKKSQLLGSVYTKRQSQTIPNLADILVESTSGSASTLTRDAGLTVAVGESRGLNVSLEPYSSTKGYTLRYESADPSVVSVDPSSGSLTGVRAGQATVLVHAVRLDQSDIILLDSDGSFLNADGTVWDETVEADTAEPVVVMTKEVSVTVTPAQPDTGVTDGDDDGTSVPEENPVDRFTDVNPGDWFYDSVNHVVSKDYFKGTGNDKFAPYLDMTRSMFVTVLGRLEGVDGTLTETSFTDVPDGLYYTPYVSWAASAGLVEGAGNGLFLPDVSITREQAAKILGDYLKSKLEELPDTSGLSFHDRDEIADWALDGVTLTAALGIFQGNGAGNFCPKAVISRAEVAAVIQRVDLLLESSRSR